ncbi:SPOR domain-containing protein [Noviherbaspirillum sedimenti]|uniref:SPOR domain-containing protein n=1 Tax=Noviherbaspirillum sedimenti TaxID=2320865 RepID=A0A3A3GNI3_9BURK|nr:SPOR domain-containing protein [Noviherbaspirillum sedimenti]RJG02510.1 SPOR domain-containing protein [Noviherbaspirillum sedimenti]
MNYRHNQAGGTFLGIIIGLIIGLGIAVGVAVTINKTPIPFVDRGFKPAKDADTGQMPDLNKSLYGNREPAKQAAKEFQKDAEPAVSAEPAGAGQAAPPNQAAVAPAKAPAVDKPADKPADKAKPADGGAAAKDAAAGDEKWSYYLQAGAFREQADAENAKAKLALLGVESSISERNGDAATGTLYRVRVGPFAQVDAMNRIRSKLSENGVDVAVVRIQK